MIAPKMMMALCGVLALSSISGPALAVNRVSVGTKLANAKLVTLDGKSRPYLGSAKANVFVFFRPQQAFSEQGLEKLVEVQQRMKDRPVAWTAIVSDYYSKKEIRKLVTRVGLQGPVLIDKGDALYGRLGTMVHPSVGIADADRVLTAFLPFRKVHYSVAIEAHLRRTLGEIDDAELARLLDPPQAAATGDPVRAKRTLRMGEMLFKMKKHEKAGEIAKQALALDSDLAAAHALLAATLVARGDCAGAKPSLERALELDPKDARALEAEAACRPPEPEPEPAPAP